MTNIIVYQMGKVGSRSVQDSLKKAGIPAGHVHSLSRVKNPTPNDKYITPVREPVARNLSAYFQNITKFYEDYLDLSPDQTQKLIDNFIEEYPPEICLDWFEDHIKKPLGIDVYAKEFNEYRIYNNKLLVFRIEDFSKKGAKYISAFLNKNIIPIHIHRTTDIKRKVAPYYEWAKQYGIISEEYIEKMYTSRFATHFYTDEELNKFREYWSKTPR